MIKMIKEDNLLEFKSNPNKILKEVITDKRTLEEAFDLEKVIFDTNVPCEDFKLDMSEEKPGLSDFENVKRVHKHMASLSESMAADERIWVAYSLSVFSDYMAYRWKTSTGEDVLNRYFFNYTAKRSLFRNGISRLWWIGRMTYDEKNLGNEYEVTEFICKKQDNINLLLDIGFGNSRELLLPICRAIIDYENKGIEIDRQSVRRISEYFNTLGGAYLVDAFSYDEIYNKTYNLIKRIISE